MQSDLPLDYAVFQLSPRRSRCELFVSYDCTTEKLASGLVKPFVTHLKVAEEQVALARKSIRLDVERCKNAETWFTKGTLERFVRFVSTPEVLEVVNTFDAEMSQLEAARKIYSQGITDHESVSSGEIGNGLTAASDATKKELLRAIDVRLSAVKQDLMLACHRAFAAGFNPESVSGLLFFADYFGSHRLSDACSKFITITKQRSDFFNSDNSKLSWKASCDSVLRSSANSDMSIDDLSDDHPKSSTCTTTKVTLPSGRFSREPSQGPIDKLNERGRNKEKEIDEDKAVGSTSSETESASTSAGKPQLTRRLSVQERISLFETKAQNSPSTSTATTPTSTGGKPDLRRLSSDINSSTDKAVWKRRSGASDMSIDTSGDRKEPDSNANTPTSVSSSHPLFPPKLNDPSNPKSEDGNKDTKPSLNVQFGESRLEEPVSFESNSKIPAFSGRSEKDQTTGDGDKDSRPSWSMKLNESRSEEPVPCMSNSKIPTFSGRSEKDQTTGDGDKDSRPSWSMKLNESRSEEPISCMSNSKIPSFSGKSLEKEQSSGGRVRSRVASFGRAEDFCFENPLTSNPAQIKARTGKVEQSASPNQDAMEEKLEVLSGGASNSQEDTGISFVTSENQTESHPPQTATSDLFGEKYLDGPGSDQVAWHGGRNNSSAKVGGAQMGLTGKTTLKNQEALSSTSSVPDDQFPRVRPAKGNQRVNDELKMKANELEKLFAEHKLRAPVDQSTSARRVGPTDVGEPVEYSSQMENFNSTPLLKTFDNHDNDVTPKQNMYSLSFLDDSRGKLYKKYMQKRDAKFREDWSSNRPEKEAQLKAMHVSLEKCRAEMKVKFAGSSEKRNSSSDTRRRDEKTRPFNVRSLMKRDQQLTHTFMSDEDEGQADFLGKKLTETYLRNSSSKTSQGKRVQPNKNASSPGTRNSTVSIPRSSVKASNSGGGRRKLPCDNPLAQSVPNFSDLRKENTRPSSGISKPTRLQGRNHARKNSTSEDLPLAFEEKPRRTQLVRKSMATTMEMNDSHDSEFRPSKSHPEENGDFEKISDMESKTLPGRDTNFGTEEMMEVAKDEEPDFKATVMEESIYIDNSGGRLSHESDKSENSEYENNNAGLRFVSQAESPITMPTLFRSMGSTLDSPGESPGSWNLRLQNPFTFSHEISDIDASDSPNGSSTSWNFHTLSQSEAEAAGMRKKWGAAQKPILGVDTPRSPSRKDITRGLKRFLKFGRKNRASESMADWISATTSEGDDSEDGRDLANRSLEDLGKSRMGFSQSRNSDEGFNDMFNDQVQAFRSSIPTPPSNFKLREEHVSANSFKAPKSFFSLSNFRTKGNDSKPR